MILSRAHDVIFIKPQKVAGTSFEIAFSKFAGPGDILTPVSRDDERTRRRLGFRGAQGYRKPLGELLTAPTRQDLKLLRRLRAPRRFYNHIPAAEAKARIGREIWDRCLKVSITRDPWDRAVSRYFWSARKGGAAGFEDWIRERAHVLNASDLHYLIDGVCVIDHFLRYEHFAEDIATLESRRPGLAGLAETFAGLRAKGGVRPKGASAADMFRARPDLSEIVARRCAFEVARFGYAPPESVAA